MVKWISLLCFGRGAGSRRIARCGGRCESGGREWRRRRWDPRTSQNNTSLERLGCVITVTESRHSPFGQYLTVLSERSGRGPTFVVVALPDGRKRSIRIASTDLGQAPTAADRKAPDLPRVNVRTLIPLTQHLSAKLSLLAEEVIRDDPTSSPASRSVSTPVDSGLRIRPAPDSISRTLAEPAGRDTNADCSADGAAHAAHAADGGRSKKGDRSC